MQTDPYRIKELMNNAGQAQKPFLFAVNFELTEGYFFSPPPTYDYFFSVPGFTNKPKETPQPKIIFEPQPISREEYHRKFQLVETALRRGDSYLTNLTIKTPINCSLTLREIFLLSDSPYQLYIPGRLVCFSPERFVKISGGLISTNPMKGTIDASIPDAENKILNDFKETAEHNTIVDLLRNDLSMSAKNVVVRKFRYLDHIKSNQRELLQVSSEIVGTLRPDYQNHLGDIIFQMLPAGSCTGAPKSSTVSIIKKVENEPRSFYTGVFGYFDGDTLDTAVMIRFIEEVNGKMFFRSGGGITAYSNWENEYNEALEKIYLPFR